MYKKFSMIKIYINVVSVILMLLLIIFVYRYILYILLSVVRRKRIIALQKIAYITIKYIKK